MFSRIIRKLNYLRLRRLNRMQQPADERTTERIPASIDQVTAKLKAMFSDCHDFIIREIHVGDKHDIRVVTAFIDGMISNERFDRNILRPLMIEAKKIGVDTEMNSRNIIDILKHDLLLSCQVKEVEDFVQTVDVILGGDVVIYIDGVKTALSASVKGWEVRNVEEPNTDVVIRGPREGFTETLRTNTSMIRRKIKSPKLKFEHLVIGKRTKTEVCICYIKGIANDSIVDTVKRRLNSIQTDAILESGYIEEFIEDTPLSLFRTTGSTEKPDIVAGRILEGRVAIICDGTPFVLTVPMLFVENIQTSEDYYRRAVYSSLIRILRLIALVISTSLPGLYVALINFHQAVIPLKLMLNTAASREGIPFTPFIEALVMGVVFEILREAGLRMPRQVGQAVSIVGALVLGESAVRAGLTSNPMVIVVALTAISSFVNPKLEDVMPYIRFFVLVGANILGIMGITLVIMALFIHLCSLRSFGVPYLAPIAPLNGMDLKDTYVKFPVWMLFTRPKALIWDNADRSRYRMDINYNKKEG